MSYWFRSRYYLSVKLVEVNGTSALYQTTDFRTLACLNCFPRRVKDLDIVGQQPVIGLLTFVTSL